jgi:hypothetical protein
MSSPSRFTTELLARFALVLAIEASACGREHAPSGDSRTACERALGTWVGDDVDTRETDPAALAVARDAIRAQHWRITENTFESREPSGRVTRESSRVTSADRDRCEVELTLGDRSRRLNYALLPDGRLRIAATGGSVGMILRRE